MINGSDILYDWDAQQLLCKMKISDGGVCVEFSLDVDQAMLLREGLNTFLASAAKILPSGRQ